MSEDNRHDLCARCGHYRLLQKIYTLCVDPERGRYLAISTDDPMIQATAYNSEDEAVGILVRTYPGITIDQVISVDLVRATPQITEKAQA